MMKMKKKKLLIGALTVLLLCFTTFALFQFATGRRLNASPSSMKEGDIIFRASYSQQAPYIQAATMSPWSHCGIIIEKEDGLYVLEAVKTIRLTPLNDWIKLAKHGIYKTRRICRKAIKIDYKAYLGAKYDLQFKFDNGRWYCSELVYDIYLKQFGIKLAEPRPVSSYHIRRAKKLMESRGISPKQLVVAPSDLD